MEIIDNIKLSKSIEPFFFYCLLNKRGFPTNHKMLMQSLLFVYLMEEPRGTPLPRVIKTEDPKEFIQRPSRAESPECCLPFHHVHYSLPSTLLLQYFSSSSAGLGQSGDSHLDGG